MTEKVIKHIPWWFDDWWKSKVKNSAYKLLVLELNGYVYENLFEEEKIEFNNRYRDFIDIIANNLGYEIHEGPKYGIQLENLYYTGKIDKGYAFIQKDIANALLIYAKKYYTEEEAKVMAKEFNGVTFPIEQ